MFIANDLQMRIANDHLDDLRRDAARRRDVRLVRAAARTGAAPAATHDGRSRRWITRRIDDVRSRFGPRPNRQARPCDVVSLDTCRPAAERAA